ncbi:MAG: cadherin repeat domain-containing protein [Pirellulales bacterium]
MLSVDVVDGQALTIAENSLNNSVVGTPVVTQTVPGPLTYSITAGNDSNAFLINPVSGEIRVADGSQLDFETKPTWQLTVEAFLNGDPTQRDSAVVNVGLSDVSGSAAVNITGTATLSLVGGRLSVASGGTTLFSAGVEDVSSLVVNGSAAADTLTIDFSGGNPIPAGGLTFNGLAQPVGSAGDALVLQNGTFDGVDYRFDNGHDGGIVLTQGAATSSIEYRGLEPIVNTGTAADMTFTLGAAADHAVLEELTPGTLRLRSTDAAPTFEAVTFAVPTNSLTIRGGDGADTVTVRPINGTFALTIDGQAGDDVLIIDQLDAPVAAPAYTFAGFNFIQPATPDQAVALAGLLDGGFGVNVTAPIGSVLGVTGFPDSTAGFDPALSIGRLLNPALVAGTLGVNLPASNIGTVDRAGFVVSWSGGRTLSEQAGDDFVIYESGDANEPDAMMVQVHVAGVGWTKWRYETPDSFAPYGGAGTAGTFATAFDLADFGLTGGQSIDAIRVVNMTAADRMEGPGTERVTGSGVFVSSGFVIPGDKGATSNVLPDPARRPSLLTTATRRSIPIRCTSARCMS